MLAAPPHGDRSPRRASISRALARLGVALAALLVSSLATPLPAQPTQAQPTQPTQPLLPQPMLVQLTDGERAWRAGYEAALSGQADSAMRAYGEALRLAHQDKDQELASAARLGMAEVWDVWRRCRDSARAAYVDATQLASEGDYAAADAFAIWLARQGIDSEARALHARTYQPIENEVPRTVTRESVNFLVTLAAIQVANSSRSGAMVSLSAARDIADRLAAGDQHGASTGITEFNYWALHDIATLQIDPASRNVRNLSAGTALRSRLDAAVTVNDNGGHPRFSVGRLADRVARQRRTCKSASCRLPPPPPAPRCR